MTRLPLANETKLAGNLLLIPLFIMMILVICIISIPVFIYVLIKEVFK